MSNQQPATTPKTWFANESGPDSGRKRDNNAGTILALCFIVFAPMVVIVALLSYFMFSKMRIKQTVILQLGLLTLFISVITGAFTSSLMGYIPRSAGLIKDAFSSEFTWQNLGILISQQIPAALPIGLLIGATYCYWRWFRRAEWQSFNFRLTPYEYFRKKKNINDIKEDKNSPKNGSTLGINPRGKRITQLDKEAAAHTIYFGASGAGKTTTMMMQVRDLIKRGQGMIIIDLKGSAEFAEWAEECTRRYGGEMQHFLFHDPRTPYTGPAPSGPSFYNPLGRGDASRRKDMVIAGRNWSEDYYKNLTSDYLQTAFNVMIGNPSKELSNDSLKDIIELLDIRQLEMRSLRLPQDSYYREVRHSVEQWTHRKLTQTESSAVDGMKRELNLLRSSSAGQWLRAPQPGHPGKLIDLEKIAREGGVAVFSLDSLTYPELAPTIANLIIEDLKTLASDLAHNPSPKPFPIFIDEFSAIDSANIIGLINKSRSAGMPLTLATQAIGDLRKVDSTFLDQLLGISNSYVIHRANLLDDAILLAGLIGMEKQWDVNLNVSQSSGVFGNMDKGAATGEARIQQKDDFIVSPTTIQELQPGEAIYLAKAPTNRNVRIKVIAERDSMTTPVKEHYSYNNSFINDLEHSSGLNNVSQADAHQPVSTQDVYMSPDNSSHEVDHRDFNSTMPPTNKSTGWLGGRDLNAGMMRVSDSSNNNPKNTSPPTPSFSGFVGSAPPERQKEPEISRVRGKQPIIPLPTKPMKSTVKPDSDEAWTDSRWD